MFLRPAKSLNHIVITLSASGIASISSIFSSSNMSVTILIHLTSAILSPQPYQMYFAVLPLHVNAVAQSKVADRRPQTHVRIHEIVGQNVHFLFAACPELSDHARVLALRCVVGELPRDRNQLQFIVAHFHPSFLLLGGCGLIIHSRPCLLPLAFVYRISRTLYGLSYARITSRLQIALRAFYVFLIRALRIKSNVVAAEYSHESFVSPAPLEFDLTVPF